MSAEPARPSRPPEVATLDVLEFDGHGTSRAMFKDRSIEVEHGIPGERVTGLVHGRRRRWAKINTVLTASPDRVDAPCVHFHDGCGGCQWQMLAYASQVDRKVRRARQAFESEGLTLEFSGCRTMDEPWRYRETAGLSLGQAAGFRRRASRSIVAVHDCPISHPLIGRLSAWLNRRVNEGSSPNFRGEVSVEVRVTGDADGQGIHVCVTPSPGSAFATVEAIMPLARILAGFDRVSGVLYRHRQDPPRLLFGDPLGWRRILGREFALSGATFFQTNLRLLPELLRSFTDLAAPTGGETVVDVYGGVGLFGLWLAPSVTRVIEVELDPVGTEAARHSADRQGIHNVDFVTGTAESVLSSVKAAETVIVDPPRSGLTPKVVQAIGELRPRSILYVSCLAASMARDVAAFARLGYRLGPIEAFDFYPQTYHLELLGRLDLGGA